MVRPASTRLDSDDLGFDFNAVDVVVAVRFAVVAVAVTVVVVIAVMVDLERPKEYHQSAVAGVGTKDDTLTGDDHAGWGHDGRRGHRLTGSHHRIGERPRQARQHTGSVEHMPERGHDVLATHHGTAVSLHGGDGGALADDDQQSLTVVTGHANGLPGSGGGCCVSRDPGCVVLE